MIRTPRLRVVWLYVEEYAPAFLAVDLMFKGLQDIIWPLKYHFINAVARLVNPVIEKYLPGHLILVQYSWMHLRFEVSYYSFGVIFVVTGIFFGLWAKVRSDRRLAQ